MNGSSAILARYKAELPSMLVVLAVLAAAAIFLKLHLVLVGGIFICIVAAPLFPPRYAWVASLLGFGGLAALSYFYFGQERVALALAAIGLILAATSYLSKGRL